MPNAIYLGTRVRRGSLLASTALVSLLCFDLSPALAQQASPSASDAKTLEEVVVTARQRSERLSDVPVAVSAMTASELQQNGAASIAQIGENLPGLNIGQRTAGGAGAGITIRGIGTDGSNAGIAQSVSIDIDGVQTSQGRALWGSQFDLQQVEVLKGPQALFFGKNSPAGVVSLTSKNPTDHFEAEGSVSYELNADEFVGDAAVGGPIGDNGWKARFAMHGRNMEGYIYDDAPALTVPSAPPPYNHINGGGGRLGESEYAGRLTVAYDDGGPLTGDFKFTYDHYFDDGGVYNLELSYCGGDFPQSFNSIFGTHYTQPAAAECTPNWHTYSGQLPLPVAEGMKYGMENGGKNYSQVDTGFPSLRLNYKIGDDLNLASQTSFYSFFDSVLMNNDWTSYDTISGTEADMFKQVSQQLRLSSSYDGPFNFMIGGFYEHITSNFFGAIKFDDLPADPVTQQYETSDDVRQEASTTLSGFAQVTYKVIPEVELSGGARYSHDVATGSVADVWTNPVVAGAFPLRTIPGGSVSGNVSPEFSVTYRPDDDVMVYAAYKTGYKAGGLSLSALVNAATTPEEVSFKKETARGWEGGVKAKFLENRAQLQFDAYRYVFDSLQVSAYDPAARAYVVRNAAAAEDYGAELEGKFKVTPELLLEGSFDWNHSRYSSFQNAACYAAQTLAEGCTPTGQDLTGRPTLSAPDFVGTVGFDYHRQITSDYYIGVGTNVYYSTDYYYIQTQAPEAKQSAFARLDANVRLNPADGNWQVSIIGRNLTNRKVLTSGQDTPLSGSNGNPTALNGALARPWELIMQLSYYFE
jgi:outer membrane receptor protein involved in Fe transport